MTEARVDVITKDDVVRIVLAGEIDMANAVEVEDQICEVITNQVTEASIDLTEVTYLDSAGLRVLFGLAERLPTLQIALELVAPVESPSRRVLELSGLAAVVPVVPVVPEDDAAGR
jgi:stage II sporulation protein AA (anti-sigma F factor antagonist)